VPDVDVARSVEPSLRTTSARLGVRLESDEPVDDVGAGLLELCGAQTMFAFLVEAGFDLDQGDDCLPAPPRRSGRARWGVAACAVEGHP